jgi:hypothetical protein
MAGTIVPLASKPMLTAAPVAVTLIFIAMYPLKFVCAYIVAWYLTCYLKNIFFIFRLTGNSKSLHGSCLNYSG